MKILLLMVSLAFPASSWSLAIGGDSSEVSVTTTTVSSCLRVPASGVDLISGPCAGGKTAIGTVSPKGAELTLEDSAGAGIAITKSNTLQGYIGPASSIFAGGNATSVGISGVSSIDLGIGVNIYSKINSSSMTLFIPLSNKGPSNNEFIAISCNTFPGTGVSYGQKIETTNDNSNTSQVLLVRSNGQDRFFVTNQGNIAVGYSSGYNPSITLDVNAAAHFGVGANKSTVSASGFMIPAPYTLAQIQAKTPAVAEVGGIVVCSNCASPYSICQATGSATNQAFRLGITGTSECK